METTEITYWALGAAFVVAVVWISVTVAANAWFKAKLEHLKRVMHITRGDD